MGFYSSLYRGNNHRGLWEAAVKSTKHHLKRALINRNVTFEELNTLIIQVEGILNSRPLFAMSNDPNDLNSITPSHFLIGRATTHLPEPDLTQSQRLTRFQHIQRLYQQFWNQFSKNYVSQLHHQYKWRCSPPDVKPLMLVLIQNDKQPPCRWKVGRIIRIFSGKDNVIRTAEVKTSNGTIIRSIRHLCPFPCQDDVLN